MKSCLSACVLVGNAQLPRPIGGIWAVNGNMGEWHVLTENGFYLTRLFQSDGFKLQWPDQAVPGGQVAMSADKDNER